jgi:hypothetical protein
MANREPIQYVEMDVDYCSRTYGDSFCGASLVTGPTRTNYALHSEDLGNPYWFKVNCFASANNPDNPAPNGTLTASSFNEGSVASVEHFVEFDPSVAIAGLPTGSVYLRAGSRTHAHILITGNNGTTGVSDKIIINLTTGTITSGVGGVVDNVGGGWYRLSVTATSAATNYSLRIGGATASGTIYTGTNSGFVIWGAQLENGSPASVYKPTVTEPFSSGGATGVRKCFNTFATCQSRSKFTKASKTLTFINNRSNLPKGLIAYPALKDNGISAFSSTVNVAGSNPRMNAFGRRASVTVALKDFVDDDVWFDKYQLERISGAAQANAIGYDPGSVGTFFTRLKARWPYYAGRPMRVIDGYVDGGILTVTQTRHFILTDMKGPDSSGDVTFEAKDVLALADDKKALAPTPSRGKLGANITNAVGQAFVLTPSGIEVEYPASGWGTIGSEVVTFTRSGATVTLTGRGQEGTVAAAHSLGDTLQVALYINNARVDDTIYDLLVNYAKVPASFCPIVAEWAPEITRWMSSVLLKTIITKPTGVAQLVGELSDIGVSVWWDDINQKVRLLATHPVADELIVPVTDNLDIKSITQEDFDEDRVTQVHFYTKQSDPTKDYKDKNNYDRLNVLVDTTAESVNAYNDTKVREVFCRWLNSGADAIVRTLSLRLLKRLNTPPIHYTIILDAVLKDLNLADIVKIDSRISTNETGLPVSKLLQIIRRTEKKSGHEIEVEAQSFLYDERYGQIMLNTSPVYGAASDDEKRFGSFLVGSSLVFFDGTSPYLFI